MACSQILAELANTAASCQATERPFVLRTLHNILLTTPRSLPFAASKNAACLEALLAPKSAIKDWLTVLPPWKRPSNESSDLSGYSPEAMELDKISSQLHLAGMNMREVAWLSYKAGQPFREEVYRCSNFDETNFFGPYEKRTDGRMVIDWHIVNAISTVMALNVHGAWDQVCRFPSVGMSQMAALPLNHVTQWGEESQQDTLPYGFSRAVFWRPPTLGRDWACVTGRWNYICVFTSVGRTIGYG